MDTIDPLDTLLQEDVAEIMHRATGTLENWRSQKVGPPYIKTGGKGSPVLYSRASLIAWLKRHEQATTDQA